MHNVKGPSSLSDCNRFYVGELARISKLPPLTREQEREFIIKYRETGDIDARNEVIVRSLLTVMSMVKGIEMNNKHIEVHDIISVLNEHLIDTLDKYDVDSLARFNTFANYALRYKIISYLEYGWQTVRMPKSWSAKWKSENENMTYNDFFVSLDSVKDNFLNDVPIDEDEKGESDSDYVRSYFEKNGTQIEADIIVLRYYCNEKTIKRSYGMAPHLYLTRGEIRKQWNELKKRHKEFFERLKRKIYNG